MRASPAETGSATHDTNGEAQAAAAVLNRLIERMSAEQAACEKLGDPELARRAGRNLLTAVACAADAILANAQMLQSAPDKVAAFFDKSATACVAAIEGLHKRAVLTDLAAGAARAPGPRLDDYAVWGPPKTS
jgi:hypothetical protein